MKKQRIERLLPAVFQNAVQAGNPLFAILDVMETMHAPSESTLDSLDGNFNPYRAPDTFVPYLAGWVDLEMLFDVPRSDGPSSIPSLSTGLGRLRELTAAAVTLSQWRGTRKGLCQFLETATGTTGFQVEEQVPGADGKVKPFHLRITAPQKLTEHSVLIQRIVELEKPAYVTYELRFGRLPDQPATAYLEDS
jgi:phage tail-like protein